MTPPPNENVRPPLPRLQHALLCAVGLIVLGLAASAIDGDKVTPLERDLFVALNHLPGALYVLIWPVMQLGNVIAPPILALGAGIKRLWRLAAALALITPVKLVAARVVKDEVVRHRPASFLDDVVLRGDAPLAGQSFVSGHTTIAFAVAAILHPYVAGRWRVVVWSLAVLVGIGRIYVGAHLPLDVVGGAGLGTALGALLNLCLAAPPLSAASETRDQPRPG